jgi:hypothetical protein
VAQVNEAEVGPSKAHYGLRTIKEMGMTLRAGEHAHGLAFSLHPVERVVARVPGDVDILALMSITSIERGLSSRFGITAPPA